MKEVAALICAQENPQGLEIVCLDKKTLEKEPIKKGLCCSPKNKFRINADTLKPKADEAAPPGAPKVTNLCPNL